MASNFPLNALVSGLLCSLACLYEKLNKFANFSWSEGRRSCDYTTGSNRFMKSRRDKSALEQVVMHGSIVAAINERRLPSETSLDTIFVIVQLWKFSAAVVIFKRKIRKSLQCRVRLSAADSRQILAFVECRWHVSDGIYPISSNVHGHVDGLNWRINKRGRVFPISLTIET